MDSLQNFCHQWVAFCDADYFEGRDTFTERMENEGLIEFVPVDEEALDQSFAHDRGIEKGGMMWRLTSYGNAIYKKYMEIP